MKDFLQDEPIGFLIGHTYRRMIQHVTAHLRQYDLTTEQFAVLYRLSQQDGINQKELALRSAKDQPTITRILDALSKKGVIEKKLNESDRRAFLISLSPKGWELVDQAAPSEAKAIAEVFAGISPEQMDQLRQILSAMNANIDRYTNE